MTALHAVFAAVSVLRADTGKKVSFTGDAGLVNASGNSNITTLNVADKLGVRLGKWSIAQGFSYTYATTNDTVSASVWHAALRGDRAVSSRAAVYVLTEYDRNRFAGIASRISPSVGVSILALADGADSLRAEAGVGYTWQQSFAPDSARRYASGRLAVSYHRRIGAHAAFEQEVEFLPDFEDQRDYRINSQTAVIAPITTGIGLKASYVIHYDGVPEAGYKHTDRILTTGVQVTF